MVTDEGRVKVLDFGLAKLVEPDQPNEDASTRTLQEAAPKTDEGAIVGTAAYMSPEQAEGKKLDGRSDIFSFGSVLYEMSTGRRAFQGETKLSTLSAILREEPKPASELAAAVPRELERIIQRCLRKDPARRFQSYEGCEDRAGGAEGGVGFGTANRSAATAAQPTKEMDAGRGRAVVLLGAAGTALWWRPRPTPAPVEWRLRPLTADSGIGATTPALSPDGKLMAYASSRASNGTNLDLWVQPLAEGSQPIRLTQDPADDISPSFSPDGGQIAFFSHREGGGIYLISVFGGEERLLVRGGSQPSFSPDGRWVAYSNGGAAGLFADSKVFVMPAGGGAAKRIAADIPRTSLPIWSPDGRHLLVFGAATTKRLGLSANSGWFRPREESRRRQGWSPCFGSGGCRSLPEGVDWIGDALYFGSDSSIWTIGFRDGSPQPETLRKLASSTTGMVGVRGSASKLVFESRTEASHLWSVPLDSNSGRVRGPRQLLPHAGGSQALPSFSSDGSRMVFLQRGANSYEMRLRDMSTGTEKVLSTGPAKPKISPDGTKVAYVAGTIGLGPLFLMASSGGEATKLLDQEGGVRIYGWSADGKKVVYWHGTPVRFSVFDLETRQTSELISHPTYDIHGAELSPDGNWVAFHLPRPVTEPLKIAPVRQGKAAAEAEWITVTDSVGTNRRPWWSPDGNLLYFVSTRDNYQCIWAQPLDPATKRPRGEPMAVYHSHEARRMLNPMGGAPAMGGGRMVFALSEQSGNIWLAEPAGTEQ